MFVRLKVRFARMKPLPLISLVLALLVVSGCRHFTGQGGFVSLFPEDGVPKGWVVHARDDVGDEVHGDAVWRVENRGLRVGEPRGSRLLGEMEYGDFELEVGLILGEIGNDGCALRVPL